MDFVAIITKSIMPVLEYFDDYKFEETNNVVSNCFGFSDYDSYLNSEDKNKHLHESILHGFCDNLKSYLKKSGRLDLEKIPDIAIEESVRGSFFGMLPIYFNLLDIFECGRELFDLESNFHLKRDCIIRKIIVPVIKELQISDAHSISDVVKFCELDFVYDLYLKLNKWKYMRNLKIMKSFMRNYDSKTGTFSENANVWWHIILREYGSYESVFDNFFSGGNVNDFFK